MTAASASDAFRSIAIGAISAETPKISSVLAMFDPAMLPQAMPGDPANAA